MPVSGTYHSYYSGLIWIGPRVQNDNKSKCEGLLKLRERRGNYSFQIPAESAEAFPY